MSTKENGVSTTTTTTTPPTPNNVHAEVAQGRVEELRRWREQIPNFVIPASPTESRRLSNAASVPQEFVELTNLAVANQAALVRVEAATPAEVRDLTSYADAYTPLADELEALAQFLRFSVKVARSKAGYEALTTYALASRLAKRPATAGLAPVVADMRRALGRVPKKSPEVLAKRAAERAVRAAARAEKAAQALAAADPTTQSS
jgi:hypothetical protein